VRQSEISIAQVDARRGLRLAPGVCKAFSTEVYLYLRSFANGSELREGLRDWFRFYNCERFHQSLDNRTPDEVYYDLSHPFAEAA
jgi:transposase InsO family protein